MKTEAIILQRSNAPGDSLLLKTLSENGYILKFKIPGILKSKKRNNYYMAPGSLWEFTLPQKQGDFTIPLEYRLIYAPFSPDSSYRNLELLSEMLSLLRLLKPDFPILECFQMFKYAILDWENIPESQRLSRINRFYLEFIETMGLFYMNDKCERCSTPVNTDDFFVAGTGSLCKNCLSTVAPQGELIIPRKWIEAIFNQEGETGFKPAEETVFRNRIKAFLENNL